MIDGENIITPLQNPIDKVIINHLGAEDVVGHCRSRNE
jgi:hypothetical protein